MVLKFSPTSPTRRNVHQLLNPHQPKGFEDVRHLVLHMMLLVSGPQDTHCHTYVRICVPMGMLCVGARNIPWRIFYRNFFCACYVKGRHTFCGCVSLFSDIRRAFCGHVSLFSDTRHALHRRVSHFLHQKLNYC
jgi:hypothetical protein